MTSPLLRTFRQNYRTQAQRGLLPQFFLAFIVAAFLLALGLLWIQKREAMDKAEYASLSAQEQARSVLQEERTVFLQWIASQLAPLVQDEQWQLASERAKAYLAARPRSASITIRDSNGKAIVATDAMDFLEEATSSSTTHASALLDPVKEAVVLEQKLGAYTLQAKLPVAVLSSENYSVFLSTSLQHGSALVFLGTSDLRDARRNDAIAYAKSLPNLTAAAPALALSLQGTTRPASRLSVFETTLALRPTNLVVGQAALPMMQMIVVGPAPLPILRYSISLAILALALLGVYRMVAARRLAEHIPVLRRIDLRTANELGPHTSPSLNPISKDDRELLARMFASAEDLNQDGELRRPPLGTNHNELSDQQETGAAQPLFLQKK